MRIRLRALGAILAVASLPAAARADDFAKGPWIQDVRTGRATVIWEADEIESPTPTVDYGASAEYELGTVNALFDSVNGYPVYAAEITGLATDTLYHYSVTSGSTQSLDATFKTAPAKGTTGFRFYVAGDNRTYPGRWGAVTERIRLDMGEYPENHQTFLLNNGDVVTDGRDYENWDELWPPAQRLLSQLPLYVGLGNHEDRNTAVSDDFIYGYFDFPYLTAGSTDEKWYSFDYGNLHLAAMAIYDNVGYTSGPQYNWIQSDLDDAQQDALTDWSFALLHFLPWSLGGHVETEATDLQTYIHPILSNEDVTCAFGGHNHIYCRYEPVGGVSYITSGGAGAPLHEGTFTPWSGATLAAEAQLHHYCVVDVEEDAVSVRAIDMDGNRVDYVTFGGTAADRPPFADAGDNVTGTVSTLFTLDGSASDDPEGAGIAYSWTQISGPSVSLAGADTDSPTFTPSVGGKYLFRLEVDDGTYGSAPDFCEALASAGTLTLNPEADTYIDNLNPTTNYGSDTTLLLDTESHEYHTYVRFNVSGIQGDVLNATLRLYCIDSGDNGQVRTSSDTAWDEGTPTWNSPLDEEGTIVGYIWEPAAGDWAEADVTDAIAGDGPVTLVILPSGSGGADFHSRENTNPPELVVRYDGLDPADLEPDGDVDADDLAILSDAANWAEYAPDNDRANIDDAGTVDALDLGIMMSSWAP